MASQSKDRPPSQAQYRVILSGNVMPECDRQQVIEGLASLFHSQASTMENLLKGIPTPLKKQYDKARAQLICTNIRAVGAQCRIAEIPASESNKGESKTEAADGSAPESGVENQTYSTDSSATGTVYSGLAARLMRFVKHNTDYYYHQFSKFSIPFENDLETTIRSEFKVTWHWPAFFCFFFWALYRKMWFWAAIHIIGGVGLMWVNSAVISLIWLFIWPVLANYLYFRTTATAVNRVLENPETKQYYFAKGGVSKVAVYSGIIIVLVSSVLVGNYMSSRFLDEYGEQIKAVLPGSGTQIRGTGLSLEGVGAKSKLARTSLTLSALATLLKILLLKNNPDNNAQHELLPMQSVIATFIEHLNAGEVSDGWGSQIRVEQHVNRYVLISAGPDQVFKTDDDVLQPIAIY